MTNKYQVVKDDQGNALRISLVDNLDQTYSMSVARYAIQVIPTDQASVAAYADVVGSTLDSLRAANVSYTILNNGANSITYQVLADNDPAFGNAQVVAGPTAVGAAASSAYTAAPAPYRYYKVQIKDTVGGNHGQSHLFGVAKG